MNKQEIVKCTTQKQFFEMVKGEREYGHEYFDHEQILILLEYENGDFVEISGNNFSGTYKRSGLKKGRISSPYYFAFFRK